MTDKRDELHARINRLSDADLEKAGALLDALLAPWAAGDSRLAEYLRIRAQHRPSAAPTGTWGELLDFLAAERVVMDDDFARDLREAHALINRPLPADDPWER